VTVAHAEARIRSIEHLMDGLRKAGLEVAGDEGTATAKPAADTGS
jgi:hypothetical protein